jgi:hypothetical protein
MVIYTDLEVVGTQTPRSILRSHATSYAIACHLTHALHCPALGRYRLGDGGVNPESAQEHLCP